jgi:hypothetical protein
MAYKKIALLALPMKVNVNDWAGQGINFHWVCAICF